MKTDFMALIIQTSASLYHPQHLAPATYARPGPAPTLPDARLHTTDTDQEPMCGWWDCAKCVPGLQNC